MARLRELGQQYRFLRSSKNTELKTSSLLSLTIIPRSSRFVKFVDDSSIVVHTFHIPMVHMMMQFRYLLRQPFAARTPTWGGEQTKTTLS